MITLLIFTIIAIPTFKEVDNMFLPLFVVCGIFFILKFFLYLASKKALNEKIVNVKVSKTLTYISIFLSFVFVITINIFVSKIDTNPSFFLLFNVILPSLYILRKEKL